MAESKTGAMLVATDQFRLGRKNKRPREDEKWVKMKRCQRMQDSKKV